MKIELHLIQNFAPSNLNRDDTGAPKDCELGGYRRARISSQCQKRAVREAFRLDKLVEEDAQGKRTKRLVLQVADELCKKHGYETEPARALVMGAIEGVGLGRTKKGEGDDAWKTEYLLFVPGRVVVALAELIHAHREVLEAAARAAAEKAAKAAAEKAAKAATKKAVKAATKKAATDETADASTDDAANEAPADDGKRVNNVSKKDAKKDAQKAYPEEVRKEVEALLESARRTVDVALFGRMIADKPEWNTDASCQVAQAISTHSVKVDFDFFTAVDDFKPNDNAGSDMMGTVQFNSSCFYRYAVLDVASLRENLDGGDDMLARAVDAFVRAFVSAIPTGKQNRMAAHNFPSYALAVVRKGGQSLSLTNAFLKPARPKGEDVDLVDDSIQKLEDYEGRLREVLGDAVRLSWADRDLAVREGAPERVKGLQSFYAEVVRHATGAAP